MKTLSLTISILLLLLSMVSTAFAEDANDEIYRWQNNEFPQIDSAYQNEIQTQMNGDPQLDPTAETKEDIYNWQNTEFPRTSHVYKDQIQKNLDAFHEFPVQMSPEEDLTWQRKEFPQINAAYGDTFEDAAIQTQKLKEIRASQNQE